MALGTTAALVAGTVASSVIGGISSKNAANAQAAASQAQLALEREIHYDNKATNQPLISQRDNALSLMSGEMGVGNMPSFSEKGELLRTYGMDDGRVAIQYRDNPTGEWRTTQNQFDDISGAKDFLESRQHGGFEATPGYQFQLEQGQNALERSQAARGTSLGGAAMKEAMRFGQGLASQEYGNYYNRLSGMAGFGQQGATANQQSGQAYATGAGNALQAEGAARASGYAGVNNALQSGINGGFSILGMQQAGFI